MCVNRRSVCVCDGVLVNVIGACGSVEWVSFKRDFKRNRRTYERKVNGTFYYNYRQADTKTGIDNRKATKFCGKFNTEVIG